MADYKGICCNRCHRVCNTATFIYITATLSTLALLHIFNVTSRMDTIFTLSKKMNSVVSQFYLKNGFANDSKEMEVLIGNMNEKTKEASTTSLPSGRNAPRFTTYTTKTRVLQSNVKKKVTTIEKERPLNCSSCFLHNYTYVLNNENICKPTDRSSAIDIIVLITSIHANSEKRKALRETWLSPTLKNEGNFRYVFLLGMTLNKKLQVALETESATFKDIVQEDFIDSYNNLTLKTIMSFKWASTYCHNAKFAMKTDDDMFVNLPGLKQIVLKHEKRLQSSLGGQCRLNEGPIRQKGYKWYVPKALYPQPKYPGFCSGTGYVTSMSMARKIYEVSQHVPFFYLEDVYIGLCVHRLGMTVIGLPGFHPVRVPINCNYKNGNVITSHHFDPKLLRDVWGLKCNNTVF